MHEFSAPPAATPRADSRHACSNTLPARALRSLLALAVLSASAATQGTLGSAPHGRWSAQPAAFPVERDGASAAWDAARAELVLFGGNNSSGFEPRDDTWVWDGARWSAREPATRPAARQLTPLVYDPGTQQVLLFGGFDPGAPNGGALGDTWVWDGTTWSALSPPVSPAPRYGHGMAYDAKRGRVLLFGGFGGTYLDDTWSWDGTTWTQEQPANIPTARLYTTLGLHRASETLVLFGGYNPLGGGDLADTWTWDGADWTLQAGVAPPPRAYAHACPDATGDLLLYGGQVGAVNELDDTWLWDGSTWTPAAGAAPGRRASAAMAFDAVRGQVVVYGGRRREGSSIRYLDDTWLWDGAGWSPAPVPSVPSRRSEYGIVGDTLRGEVLLFGGWNHSEVLGDTWTWKAGLWSERSSAAAPPARSLSVMCFDSGVGGAVLFGGSASGVRLGDTWTWDGAQWSAASPATSPEARHGAAGAYDAEREQAVLFGGSLVGGYANDTWTFDGSDWSLMQPALSPPPRYRSTMVYDPTARMVLLFGGIDSSFQMLADTWAWDGSTWTEWTPAHGVPGPSGRYGASLAHDPTTGAVLLFGGTQGGASGDLSDTWVWRNGRWHEQRLEPHPSGRHTAGAAALPGGGGTLLFGGSSLSEGALRDTWIWRTVRRRRL